MLRRVLPNEQALGLGQIGLDVLEDIAATRAETLLVRQPSLDIAETTQGVEVVLLVPVQRRLVPQAFEDRMGVRPELGPVRIPVDGIFGSHVRLFLARYPATSAAQTCFSGRRTTRPSKCSVSLI